MRTSDTAKGLTFVEMLLVLAILLLVAHIGLPFFYAKQILGWENTFWTSMGINPAVAKIVEGIVGIALAIGWAKQRPKKRNQP
jgi:prepilin-type N-terminal cleavage/methylation domain-containing protein